MNICIYAASSNNISNSYITAATELGAKLAGRNHGIVFGGGLHGLMGAAAAGSARVGGNIIGIVPEFFPYSVVFPGCTKILRPKTLRERKKLLEDLSDAFIALPGGIGTFDEILEMLSLKQLSRHNKALVLYNVNHYFDPLISLLEHSVREGFTTEKSLSLIKSFDNADELVKYIENYTPEEIDIKELKNV